MVKRKRKADRVYWTTATLTFGGLVENHVISTIVPKLNCPHTELCATCRHSACKKEGGCMKLAPTCEMDYWRVAGVSTDVWRSLNGSVRSMMKALAVRQAQ